MNQRQYAGARTDRLTQSWKAGDTSADEEVYGSIVTCRSRANALIRDSGVVKAAVRAIYEEVIGTGFKFKSRIKRARQRKGAQSKYMDDQNRMVEAWWSEWSNKEHFDVAGMKSLHDGAISVLCQELVVGEAILRFINQPFGGGRVPLGMEFIDPILLDHQQNGQSSNGRYKVMGVEKDEWGRPVSYGFHSNKPSPLFPTTRRYGDIKWIPANEILHIFRSDERVSQTRGIGDLCTLINAAWDLHSYQQSEVRRNRAASNLLWFVLQDINVDQLPNADKQSEEFFSEEVSARRLAPGETVDTPHIPTSDPNTNEFMKRMLKMLTSGVGAPYERATNDYGEANYARAKLAASDREPHVQRLRIHLAENYYKAILRRQIDAAVSAGMNLPEYAERRPIYINSFYFCPPGRQMLEPAKDLPALHEGIEKGTHTMQDVLDQVHGDRSVEEQAEMIAEERKVFEGILTNNDETTNE